MSRTTLLGFIAFVTFFTVAAWIGEQYFRTISESPVSEFMVPSPLISSTNANLSSLEEAAVESCLCRRENGAIAGCEDGYKQAREALLEKIYGEQNRPESFGMASACAPVSTEIDCFEFTDGEECIVTGYSVNAASSSFENPELCSTDEARAIETAFNEEGFEGVDAMLRRILDGAAIPASQPSGGCAG